MPILTSPSPPSRVRSRGTVAAVLVAAVLLAWVPPAASSSGPSPSARGGFAGSSGETPRAHRAAVPVAVGPTVPGLDVSHWQGVIDWSKVAAAGRRFVFMKATDGNGTVDPMFASNHAGAGAAGLPVGAYHFARPDPSHADARREAQFFVGQVDPVPGDLLPVLDIETTGGLDQAEMTHWAQTWVAQVRTLTGVTPLVYTSPNGWLTRFADTTALAADGARLWVAHWGVPSPTVPAANWNGNGWVVWQHSSTGHVAGIGTPVDLDKLLGTRLGPIIIRHLSITVNGGAGTVSAAPVTLDCRTTCARNVDPNTTITLTATPDVQAYFTGWGGDCADAGTDPTCTITMHGDRDVTARFVTDITPPAPTLTAPAGFTAPVVVRFDEPTRGVTPLSVVLHEQAGGANLPVTRLCRSLNGIVPCSNVNVRSVALTPAVRWTPGRDYEVVVDPPGVTPQVRDRLGNVTPTTPLAFEGPKGLEERDLPVTQTWGSTPNGAAFGGSYLVNRQAGATLAFSFRGRSVTWYTVEGPAFGKAEVSIDGRDRGVFDLWAAHRTMRVAKMFSGLGPGSHVIEIHVRGRKRAAATDRLVVVDAFQAGGSVVADPRGVALWRRVITPGASGGAFALDDAAGAAVTIRFDGTGVSWTAATGPDRGRARVYVDGVLADTVDLYAPARAFAVVETVAGLVDGPHSVRIEATGTGQAASVGTVVTLDRLDVT